MDGKRQGRGGPLRRRILALAAAAATLWAAAVTAGSETPEGALRSLYGSAAPLLALRWELGDLWGGEALSPAALLALGEAPLLLSAREEVAGLWSVEVPEQEGPPPAAERGEEPPVVTAPVTETPLEPEPGPADNGVPARTLVPTDPSGYTVAGAVYASNSTDYALTPQDLTGPFDAALAETEGPQILIYHTHGSESYTPPPGTEIVYSGDHRTTDTRYNVVRVGDEMARVFAEAGIAVLHDRAMYDYPSYAGAYDRSLSAVEGYLKQYPSIRFLLDVHRDAIEDTEGNEYKVVSMVEEGAAAQLTVIVGSDGSGLEHPRWRENLKLAGALQAALLERYPTLARPLLLRNSRYNQHTSTGSLLVEVGAAGNSPDEAILAGRLFANTMAEMLKEKAS